jgi:hypothetical protein
MSGCHVAFGVMSKTVALAAERNRAMPASRLGHNMMIDCCRESAIEAKQCRLITCHQHTSILERRASFRLPNYLSVCDEQETAAQSNGQIAYQSRLAAIVVLC